MAVAGWEPHNAIKAGRNLRGWTQTKLAERMGQLLNEEWSRDMIASIEKGEHKKGRKVSPRELVAFVVLLGLDYDYVLRGVELDLRDRANQEKLAFADSDSSNPGYDRFAPTNTRHEAYLLNSGMARVDHPVGDCINCLLDPDFHAAAEWTDIPGQLVIDLRDEALERFLQGAA